MSLSIWNGMFLHQLTIQEKKNKEKILSDVISRPMLWKRCHMQPCLNRYMWYVISVWVHQIHIEQVLRLKSETLPQMINFIHIAAYYCVNTAIGAVQRPSAIHTQKAIPLLLYLVLNVKSDHKQSWMATIPHSADAGLAWRHSIKVMAIFVEYRDHNNI